MYGRRGSVSGEMPERIRKLKALADDERAPQGERDAARRKLRAALKAAGITEEQLDSEGLIPWEMGEMDAEERTLFLAVWHMILCANFDGLRMGKKGRVHRAICKTTAEQMADVLAAFHWYRDYLQKDRMRLKYQRREIRKRIKELAKECKVKLAAEKQLVSVMIGRYTIYYTPPPQDDPYKGDTLDDSPPPAQPELSEAEKRRRAESHAAYSEAYRQATDGESWQKPRADLAGEPFRLE